MWALYFKESSVRNFIKRKLKTNFVIASITLGISFWPLNMIAEGDINFDRYGGLVWLLLGSMTLFLLCFRSIVLILLRPYIRDKPRLKERLYNDCWTFILEPVKK
jgi:hypothetical protein